MLTKSKIKLSKYPMSTFNLLEKPDKAKTSTIVNTSAQAGNVNLNVVLNRVKSQSPSLSSDSDIKVIPPENFQRNQAL